MKEIQKNYIINILAIALGAIILCSKLYFLNVPAGSDESIYLILGSKLLEGFAPYVTYYEMKPPFLFFNYALVSLFAGLNVTYLHVASLVVTIISTISFYFLTKKLLTQEKAIVSALVFFVLSCSPNLVGYYLVAEHFVVMYLLLALNFIINSNTKKLLNLSISGALFCIAILTKQTGIFFFIVFVYILYFTHKEYSFFKKIIYFSIGGFVVGCGTLLYLFMTNAIDEAYYFLFSHSKEYIESIGFKAGIPSLKYLGSKFLTDHILIIILSTLGFYYLIRKKESYIQLSAILLLLFGLASIIPGYRYLPQYWILVIPGISMLASEGLGFIKNIKLQTILTLSIIFFHILININTLFVSDKDGFVNSIFNSQALKEIKILSKKLKNKMDENDKLLVLGAIPQVYLYTSKSPFTRHVWTTMISNNNDKCAVYRSELIEKYHQVKPEYIFFSYNPYHWSAMKNSSDEIYKYMFKEVSYYYQKIMAMDLDTGIIYADDEVLGFEEKNNSMFIYKLNE